jgi:hypothetical protein
MAEDEKSEIISDKWYSANEAAPLVQLKEATLKKKLRDKQIKGKQVGTKKVWYIQGKAISEFREKYNLDGI